MDYRLTFLFEEPRHYNLSIVRGFYANMSKDPWTKVVIVQGMEVNITLITINRVLGTLDGTPAGSFQEL